MNICGYNNFDVANGPGIRVTIYVSGCTLKCKGCFNPESWDFEAGEPFDHIKVFNDVSKKGIAGISILGGDPLEPAHIDQVTQFCFQFKQLFPEKTIWLWTGRSKRFVQSQEICKYVDVFVTGPYVEKLQCHGKYHGSSNQQVWYGATGEIFDGDIESIHAEKETGDSFEVPGLYCRDVGGPSCTL